MEQVKVEFAGDGSGVAEMSWGQWEIWIAMTNQESSLPIGGITPLPEGKSVGDVADELQYLMSRYQSLRTRLVFDDAGRPLQSVSSEGEIVLEVYDAGQTDPAETAAAINVLYADKPFDFVNEWLVRMAVVCQDGKPAYLVVIMCHLLADGPGAMVMIDEVTRRVMEPVDGMQPLEQARWQSSPAGLRYNEAAMRYWDRMLATIPPGQLASPDPRSPRYWEGQLKSRALLLALRAIRSHTGADTSAVFLALYAVAQARITGVSPVATRPVVSNRFRPGLSNVVCMLAQAGLCVIDVAGVDFGEAVSRAQRSAMTAYKYAYFHPEQLPSQVGIFFNDRRIASRSDVDSAVPSADEVKQAIAESTFEWVRELDKPFDPLFVHVDDGPDLIQLTVDFDTQHFSPANAKALLLGMEAVAIEAVIAGALRSPESRR